jgi:hypothetical protein
MTKRKVEQSDKPGDDKPDDDKPGDRQDVHPLFADNLATRIIRGRVTSFSGAIWSLPMRRSSDGARAGSTAVMASSLPIVALFF